MDIDHDQLMDALNRLVSIADTVSWIRLNDPKWQYPEKLARELADSASDVKHLMTYGKLPE